MDGVPNVFFSITDVGIGEEDNETATTLASPQSFTVGIEKQNFRCVKCHADSLAV